MNNIYTKLKESRILCLFIVCTMVSFFTIVIESCTQPSNRHRLPQKKYHHSRPPIINPVPTLVFSRCVSDILCMQTRLAIAPVPLFKSHTFLPGQIFLFTELSP
jgi:hypothetical protein